MSTIEDKARMAAENEEVIAAMKTLSKFGLGVLLVHAHDGQGNFTNLKSGVVAYEENLKVTFRQPDPKADADYVPVAWAWDEDSGCVRQIMKCRTAQWCEQPT